MIVNKYYVVDSMEEGTQAEASALGACAILVGIPESMKETASLEKWVLPHLWVEEFTNPEVGPEDVTQLYG